MYEVKAGVAVIVLPLVLLCGCAGKDVGSVASGLATPYIQTADAKEMSEEKVARQSRSDAMGVVANLGGPAQVVRAQLSVGIVVLGTVPFPEGQKFVEGIRDRLLAHWPYNIALGRPKVEITCNTEYGAESLADNTIQIPIGVIEKAKSEDEIAFVVGHEAGHLLMQHQARREATLNTADIGIKVATVGAMLAVDLAGAKRTTVGNTVNLTVHSGTALGTAAGAAGGQMAGAEILTTLIDPGWGRRQEEQADLIGIDLMTAAGYNPQYTSEVFNEISEEEKKGQQRQKDFQRRQELAEAQAKSDQKTGSPEAGKPPSIGSVMDLFKPITTWIGDGLQSLRVNHPDTDVREKVTADYRDRFYSEVEGRRAQDDNLKRIQLSRGFRNIMQAIEHVRGASDAMDDNDPKRAISEAVAAQRLLPTWWVPSYVAGLAFIDAGDTRDGVKQLIRATDQPEAPYPVFERAAFEIANSGDVGGGIGIFDKAATRFGGPDVTWPDRIILYTKSGNQTASQEVEIQCAKSENLIMRQACAKAAYVVPIP